METLRSLFIGSGVFLWITIGFGTKELLKQAQNDIWKFPLVPLIWPLVLIMAAFFPLFTDKNRV